MISMTMVVFIGKVMAGVLAALVIGPARQQGGERAERKVLWSVGAVIIPFVCGI